MSIHSALVSEDIYLSSPSLCKRLAELSSAVLVKLELTWDTELPPQKIFFFNEGNTFVSSKLQLAPSLGLCSPCLPTIGLGVYRGLSLAFHTLRRFGRETNARKNLWKQISRESQLGALGRPSAPEESGAACDEDTLVS